MEPTDKRFFAQTLFGMAEIYEKKLNPAVAEIYFDDLRQWPLQEVLQALSDHRKDPERGRWFPKVADVVHKLQGTKRDAGVVAWAAVLPLLKNSRTAMSADPITERVVQDLGGWTRLAMTDQDKLTWVQKEFVERYEIYSQHGDVKQLSGPRTGLRLVGRDE